ncbi:IclR family transcriptional regulator [Haematobacter massiliensis]|uniref:IclR family transcriptional regulator n=1 Tax=Haematobacter massiliensis TaxID=195105 RepID=A0A086Y524_9RHOB|nr:IclR family transcriptional regulator [Haematobacter massiliensis]KFI29374.1 IclR family transcriptional regulator [Haematobacter massiliensis]OWJ71183.1 IclR family transcriptional regulator [Haematobacter massiliensis]OWJ84278.1 IclR family transcriptional regulator [Haematobacter massiliensis]QBJ25992.1 IclR family transcriptional regulator [Haematobacter massiliensis]
MMPREAGLDPEKLPGNRDRMFVTALARGLDVLRAFGGADRTLGNQDIARRTGLPKATVCRMTHTLTELGYLRADSATGKYRLDIGVLSLGYSALSSLDFREVARPFMQTLALETDASVSMGRRHRAAMVYVESARGRGPLKLNLEVGSRIPLGTTSMGKAWFAVAPEAERAEAMDFLKARHGADWPAVRKEIEDGMRDHATLGFTQTTGAWQSTIHSVGRAIPLSGGRGVLSFNCGAPALVMPADRLAADFGPRLVETVGRIEASLARR